MYDAQRRCSLESAGTLASSSSSLSSAPELVVVVVVVVVIVVVVFLLLWLLLLFLKLLQEQHHIQLVSYPPSCHSVWRRTLDYHFDCASPRANLAYPRVKGEYKSARAGHVRANVCRIRYEG